MKSNDESDKFAYDDASIIIDMAYMEVLECNDFVEFTASTETNFSEAEEALMFKVAEPMPLIRLSPADLWGLDIGSILPFQARANNRVFPASESGNAERAKPSPVLGLLYSIWIDGFTTTSTAQYVFDYEYSGINQPSNILLTTAHSIFQREESGGRGSISSAYFYSGYDEGRYIKRHRIEGWRIPKAYTDGSQAEKIGRDYAFCRTREYSYSMADVNPLPENRARIPTIAFGYPENFGFGRIPYLIKGDVALDVPLPVGTVEMLGNTFGGGASGGGWYNDDIPARLFGINSFSYVTRGVSFSMYSPRFDSQFIRGFRNTWESWREIGGTPLPDFPPNDPFRPTTFYDPC